MKIGLVSDNHSYIDEQVLQNLQSCDEIWHAGDIGDAKIIDQLQQLAPVVGVFGNIDDNDVRKQFPETQVFEREGLTIAMIHIGGYPGKYRPKAKSLIQNHKPDIFISGHSHILKVMKDDKFQLLHINPGAFGKHGFHNIRTIIRLTIKNAKIKNLEVVELGKRGTLK